MTMWYQHQALELFEQLRPMITEAGYGIGLCGGVLENGYSSKDLDIILFPLRLGAEKPEKARRALRACGYRCLMNKDAVHQEWRDKGSSDTKHVEIWFDKDRNRRIDVFFLR